MEGRGNKKMKTVQEAFQDVSDHHQPQEAYYYSSDQQQPHHQQDSNFTIVEQDDGHHHNRTNFNGINEGASSNNNTNLQFEELSDGEEVMEDQQDFVHKIPHHELRNYPQQQQQGSMMTRNPNSFLVEEQVEQEDSEGEDESGNRYVRSTKTVVNDAKSGQPQTQTKTTTKKILGQDGRVISSSTSSKTVNLGGSSGNVPVTMTSSRTVTSNGNGTTSTTFSSSSGFGGGFTPMQNPFSSGPMFNNDPFFSNPFGNDPFFNDPFGSMHNNMLNMQNNMRQQHLQAMQNMQNMQMGMHQPMLSSFQQPMFPQQGMTFGANQFNMQPPMFPNQQPYQQQNFQQQNYQQPPPQQQFPQYQNRR